MSGSVTGRGHGSSSSGVAGPGLIPKRFVWLYGGRRVLLSGTFTKWSAGIPMSPMEGCPTVFQAICGVMPGYHQYKFNVDGEWRHDEQQPYIRGDNGIVNTIYLAGEPCNLTSILSAETPSRSHMEVDNDVVAHVGNNPRISEADVQVSRDHICMFLSAHTAYELLPESGEVIALDIDLPVMQAFHVLYEQGVSMAPIWDSSKCQFVGVLGAMDFILMLKELGNHGANLREEKLETLTIAAWREGRLQHCGTDSSGRTYPQCFVHAGPHECLKDAAMKILHNKLDKVPIIHCCSENGPQLLHLASLSEILKCICWHFKHSSGSLPILQLPISSIPLGTLVSKVGESNKKPLAMLRSSASLDAALSLLIQAEVSSIPIVDDNDSLLAIYSKSDITALVKNKAYAKISLNEITIYQALLLGLGGNSLYGIHNGRRSHVCSRSDSLHTVMERLAYPGIRQLVVVEARNRRVEGIISLGDVFRFLLG